MRVESNPDISNVVRCLYLEDKTCVDIEHTQLLLNQANVDLSKVDEQKLQDEIVDMIVEQQETVCKQYIFPIIKIREKQGYFL